MDWHLDTSGLGLWHWLEGMAAFGRSSCPLGGKAFLKNALRHWITRGIHMGRIQAKRNQEPLEKHYTGYKAADWEQMCRANAIKRLALAERGIRSSRMDHTRVMHPVAWTDGSSSKLQLVDEGVNRSSKLDDAGEQTLSPAKTNEVSEDGRIVENNPVAWKVVQDDPVAWKLVQDNPVAWKDEFSSQLLVNDGRKVARVSERVRELELDRDLLSEEAKQAGPGFTRADILFEDEHLMVVNKPRGVYAGHVLRTAIHFMGAPYSPAYPLAEIPPEISGCKPHLLSRLDRDTSGVILVSKTTKATSKLVRAFASQRIDKSYVALCAGELPWWSNLTIESGHGQPRLGTWSVYPKREVGRKIVPKERVQEMVTRLTVVGSWKPAGDGSGGEVQSWIPGDDGCSEVLVVGEDIPIIQEEVDEQGGGSEILLRVYPRTARTHQTRLHCQYLGLPVLGDVKYGGPLEWNGVRYGHHALHAHTSTFKHPVTQELLHLVAPLPDWANKFQVPPTESPSFSGWTL